MAPSTSVFGYWTVTHVFNDVEQCLTTALFTARAGTVVLRVPLSRTFVSMLVASFRR